MKFSASHEWVKIEQDGNALVGISQHAQELLGDLVFIDLPKVGQNIQAGASVGVVESVKAASDLYSPVSGEVLAINTEVVADPTIVNNDPQNNGWLFKIKVTDLAELDKLMDENTYLATIDS